MGGEIKLTPIQIMKNSLKIVSLSLIILSAHAASFAGSKSASETGSHNLPEYKVEEIASLPQATHNPMPGVRRSLVGLKLKVKFTVNEKGRVKNIYVITPPATQSDVHVQSFASQLKFQMRHWKFDPAFDTNDNPIAVKLQMPVHIVRKGSKLSLLASLRLQDAEKQS